MRKNGCIPGRTDKKRYLQKKIAVKDGQLNKDLRFTLTKYPLS